MFLTLKLYVRQTELFEIEPFWYLTVYKPKTLFILNCIVEIELFG